MDDRSGAFVTAEDEKGLAEIAARFTGSLEAAQQAISEKDGVFRKGEEITIRGSRFCVQRITKKKLVLGLLPRKAGA